METMRVPVVAGRSKEHIERSAMRFLHRYFPPALGGPVPVPIADIIEYDMPSDRPNLIMRVTELPSPLEANTDSITTPGIIDVSFDIRTYNALRDGNFRARFTAAHEAGHVEMHADQVPVALSTGKFQGYARRADIPAYCDPEWQANYFAACVLMCRPAMESIVAQYGQSAEIVSELLQVSHPAAARRLMYLFGTIK